MERACRLPAPVAGPARPRCGPRLMPSSTSPARAVPGEDSPRFSPLEDRLQLLPGVEADMYTWNPLLDALRTWSPEEPVPTQPPCRPAVSIARRSRRPQGAASKVYRRRQAGQRPQAPPLRGYPGVVASRGGDQCGWWMMPRRPRSCSPSCRKIVPALGKWGRHPVPQPRPELMLAFS